MHIVSFRHSILINILFHSRFTYPVHSGLRGRGFALQAQPDRQSVVEKNEVVHRPNDVIEWKIN